MMTVAPPVVQPSLGLIAFMHGVAACIRRKGGLVRGEREKEKSREENITFPDFPQSVPQCQMTDYVQKKKCRKNVKKLKQMHEIFFVLGIHKIKKRAVIHQHGNVFKGNCYMFYKAKAK